MSAIAASPTPYEITIDHFGFLPARGIVLVAIVLFSVAVVTTAASSIYTRCYYMLISTGVAGFMLAGFVCRYRLILSPGDSGYIAMQVLLIIPPSFLALCEYLTLGKVVALLKQNNPGLQTIMRPKLLTWAYFGAEITSLALQGAGAGLSVNSDSTPDVANTGRILLIIGLAALCALIAFFLVNSVYIRVGRAYGVGRSRNLSLVFYVMYISTTLLLIRNIFRLVEFSGGWHGRIANREVYFWTLDALMIIFILAIFSVFNFGFFLKGYLNELKPGTKPLQNGSVAPV